ncbi:MAG: FAD-dependent pyridine nucleotide-disulfide oxidoreductase, partial [Candidatus Berkelbacteria bacterium Gr01-1014_85]
MPTTAAITLPPPQTLGQSDNFDQTVVIGAGPGGVSAALYLKRFGHPVTIIDAGEQIHSRTDMAPDLHNYPGHTEPVSGPEFMKRLHRQLALHDIELIKGLVSKVSRLPDGRFEIDLAEQATKLQAGYVVVAVGVGDYMPEVKGMDDYWDRGIFHCLTCDWYENRDDIALIVADDDRGLTTARALYLMNKPPRLIVAPAKTANYTAAKVAEVEAMGVEVYTSPLAELIGQNGDLEEIVLADGTRLPCQVIFTKLGHFNYDQFLEAGGLTPARESFESCLKVDFRSFLTSEPRLYAVGPCNEGPDQAVIAAGQG